MGPPSAPPHSPVQRSYGSAGGPTAPRAPSRAGRMKDEAGTQLITFKDSRVTESFLLRTPQETAHKDSPQGSSTPGRAPHPPLPFSTGSSPGPLPLSAVSRNGRGGTWGEQLVGEARPLLFQGPWPHLAHGPAIESHLHFLLAG